jgi:hypothetical protein
MALPTASDPNQLRQNDKPVYKHFATAVGFYCVSLVRVFSTESFTVDRNPYHNDNEFSASL